MTISIIGQVGTSVLKNFGLQRKAIVLNLEDHSGGHSDLH